VDGIKNWGFQNLAMLGVMHFENLFKEPQHAKDA
jgi:hypothetical protein